LIIQDVISGSQISVNITNTDDFNDISKAVKTSAGGKRKTQSTGKRFITIERFFLTMAQWRTFSIMLSSENAILFYTPTNTPEYMDASQFPLEISVNAPKKTDQTIDGERRFVIEINIESVDYV
jgi:hypothetical protein